jgi:hypothetical protein
VLFEKSDFSENEKRTLEAPTMKQVPQLFEIGKMTFLYADFVI